MAKNKLWNSRKGTSLVEILVVMVILAVGIMTVVQMFPTGFRVVRAAESETIATKLAEREIERWKNMAACLPTGILPINSADGVLNDQLPGPPFASEAWSQASSTDPWEMGNQLNIRRIREETTRIPVGTYFQTGSGTAYGSRYTLAFSPIEIKMEKASDGTMTLTDPTIKSGDLRRRQGDSQDSPPYMQPGQYCIDYGDDQTATIHLAFPPQSVVASYYVSYSYWAVNTATHEERLISVLDQSVSNVGVGNTNWQDVPVDTSAMISMGTSWEFAGVEANTDTCARAFVQMTGSGPSPDDPYEFFLADDLLGVIAFNPVGHGMMEPTARGMRPIEARITYKVLDPRIMREDKVIIPPADTAATVIPVKLALRFILKTGDPTDNANEPTFQGLAPSLGVTQSMLIIDLATGLRVSLPATFGTPPVDPIDYSAGVVSLPKTADLIDYAGAVKAEKVDLVGRHLRFFYRADGDWTLQCQKAYAVYMRDYNSLPPDYCHYRVGRIDGTLPGRLIFANCEAGKTVSVDYTYMLNGVEHKVAGESHQISDTKGDCGFDLSLPDSATLSRVYAVVGTSFKARVMWRDGKHWRYVDVDTNLTRSSD